MTKFFFSNVEKNNYIKKHLDKFLSQYEKINYAYAVLNKKNTDDMLVISDLSDDLVNSYLSKKAQHIDPVIINALSRISSFSWDENLKINSMWKVESVFESIKFLNVSGHAFVVHDHLSNIAILSIYIDRFLMKSVDCFINKSKNELQGLLIDTHEMLLHIYKDETKVSKLNKAIFSPRESEILYWCSIGKTYPEIAIILGISVRTVKFHMGNVVKKLGVTNGKHAIGLGIELNLISRPSDK